MSDSISGASDGSSTPQHNTAFLFSDPEINWNSAHVQAAVFVFFSENPFFVAGAAFLLYNGSDGRPMPFAGF